ncbi:MAG: hypothetical protein II881_02945 [Oscillospiraceae bacterium]|nr:hypothetical protein [Oscillospiraceae bacterium]
MENNNHEDLKERVLTINPIQETSAVNNINYIGAVNLLEKVRKSGIFTRQQLDRIESRIKILTGADYIIIR